MGNEKIDAFSRRILMSKHDMWFSLLKPYQQKRLYRDWQFKKMDLTLKNQTPSLRKFLYEAKKMGSYRVPTKLIRDKQLKRLLQ